MTEPGSLYYPRYNQVDFNVKKTFRAGRKTFSGQIDWFNLLNGNAVFSRISGVGTHSDRFRRFCRAASRGWPSR